MIPVSFSYHKAASVDDAISRIAENPEAKILAGGHSLVPAMKLRLAAPAELVDITGLEDLRSISVGDVIEIGALVTYAELRDHEGLSSRLPILAETIAQVGDRQVRARGTFGGCIAHADPAADLTAVLLALGGEVHVKGPKGERSIPVEEFFVDLWTTALEPEELLTRITIPAPSSDAKMTYVKHRHPASGYAIVGIAVVSEGGKTTVTITGATSKPEHLTGAENALAGGVNEVSIAAAVERAAEGITINGDLYADEEYRTHLVGQMLKKALQNIA